MPHMPHAAPTALRTTTSSPGWPHAQPTPATPPLPTPPLAAPAAPQNAAARAAAQAELASYEPVAHVGERLTWMIVTAPDQVVAGEDCVLMFNRAQSEALRCVV